MVKIYRDSNDILTTELIIGVINIDIQIKSYIPYWIGDLFDYSTHFKWVLQAYGFYNPNHDLFFFQRLEQNPNKDKKLVLLPNGQWSWESDDFELENIPF